MILLIDNYDSFTYNLYQYLGEMGKKVKVLRNDKTTLDEIKALRPERIIISPGPGDPRDAGISCNVIKKFGEKIPVLGVCLGHQCIGYVFGGSIVKAPTLMHGKTSLVYHDKKGIFKDIPNPFPATRYHSLVVSRKEFPSCLTVTAHADKGVIMGLRHKKFPVYGVQFHPESILTKEGKTLLKNFLGRVA
jgi:anthranilate synthase/aminodeoxychorismate synthase-like glutamine amidotransferase